MINIRNPNDNSDPIALGPSGGMHVIKTSTEYNEPGLPKPPAGWGKTLGVMDESIAEAPDTRPDDVD